MMLAAVLCVFTVVASGAVAAVETQTTDSELFDDEMESENGTVISNTSETVDDDSDDAIQVEQVEDEIAVAVAVSPPQNERGDASFASDGTVDIWIGAYNSQEPISQPVEGERLNLSITLPPEEEGPGVGGGGVGTQIETDANGSAHVAYDLEGNPDGEYEVVIEQADGEAQASIQFDAGPTVDIMTNRNSGMFIDEETTVSALVRNGEFVETGKEVEITIDDPDGNSVLETTSVTDDEGFIEESFTPEEVGRYFIEASLVDGEDSDSTSKQATEVTLASDFALREGIFGEETIYGGYLRNADGQLENTEFDLTFFEDSDRTELISQEGVTTDESGFFLVSYEAPDDLTTDSIYVDAEASDGTPIHVRFDRLWLDELPEEDDDEPEPEPEVTLDASVDTGDVAGWGDSTAPGGEVVIEIEAEENGEPIVDEEVDIVFDWDISDSPPLFATTVTTDEQGTATTTMTVPENALDNVRPDAQAALEFNDTVVTDSMSIRIEEYRINTNYNNMVPGETGTFEIEVKDQLTEEPVEGVPVQFAALHTGYKIDTIDTGELISDSDGTDSTEVNVPVDIGPSYLSNNDVHQYRSTDTNGFRIANHPGTLTVETEADDDDERGQVAAPGETVTLEFDTESDEVASGIVFADVFSGTQGNFGTEINSDGTATLEIPTWVEDGQELWLDLWGADSELPFYEDSVFIEIEEPEGVVADFDITTQPAGPIVGEEIAFDASNSVATEGNLTYEWEFGDGTEIDTDDPVVNHTYDSSGDLTVELTVIDEADESDSATETITVREPTSQIQHANLSQAIWDTVDGEQFNAEALYIEPADQDQIVLGEPTDHRFEIRNPETNQSVILSPEFDGSVTLERFGLAVYDGTGDIRDNPHLSVISESGYESYPVSVEGDVGMFDRDEVFTSYEARLLGDDETVLDTTEERILGIGYNGSIQQDSTTGEITLTLNRDGEIDEEWFVEYIVEEHPIFGDIIVNDTATINNETDEFEFTVDVSDVEPGNYTGAVTLDQESLFDDEYQWNNRILAIVGTLEVEDSDDDPVSDVFVVDGKGDEPNTFETIQQAVDAAEEGTTIEVEPGLYEEGEDFAFLEIDVEGVTLVSQDGPDTTGISTTGVRIDAPDVTITGFNISVGEAIFVSGENASVTANRVSGETFTNIQLSADEKVLIEDNTLEVSDDDVPNIDVLSDFETGEFTTEINGVEWDDKFEIAQVLIESNDLDKVRIGDETFLADPDPPEINLDAPESVGVNEEFELNASETTGDLEIQEFSWIITDANGDIVAENDEPAFTTSLNSPGEYSVSVTATDEADQTTTATAELEVLDQPNLVTTIDGEDEQRLGDNPTLDISIENEGAQSINESFTVVVNVTGTPLNETGDIEASTAYTIDELSADEVNTTSITLKDLTDADLVGDVTFEAQADPDDEIAEITTETNTDTKEVDVTFVGLIPEASTREFVTERQNITLRSFISNLGTAMNDEQNATVTVTRLDVNDTEEVERYNITVDSLEPGDRAVDRTQRAFNESGTYELKVATEDPPVPEVANDTSQFEVEPYNISFVGEEHIRVPSEISAGSTFSVAFEFQTNAAENVSADLDLPDEIEFEDESNAIKTIPADAGNNTVRWDLIANESSEDDVEIEANIENTLDIESSVNDTIASNISIPIATERVGNTTSVVIEEEGPTETAVLELADNDRNTRAHNLSISAQGDAEGRTLNGLEYLVRYPYGCVEQTTSSFVGALNTQEYYDDRPDADIDPDQKPVINESIEAGVERLSEGGKRGQLSEGGWNLWGNENRGEETFPTTYAMFGLSSVDNNEKHDVSELSQGNIDFEAAVESVDDLQENNGKFASRSYFRDPNAMTGFTMVTLEQTAQLEDLDPDIRGDIVEIQANASEYLVGQQTENGAWQDEGFRTEDSATSTALAIWGLQSALDSDVEFESVDTNETEIEEAIESGHQWLIDEQVQDPDDENFGAWDEYHDSGFWNQQGDTSEEAAFATYALDATNETAEVGDDTTFAIANSTEFLTSVYQERGSWGYTRASTFAVGALQQVGDGFDDEIIVTVTLGDGAVEEELEITADNPREIKTLTLDTDADELEELRKSSEDGSVDVEVETDSDTLVIVAVENDQVIEMDGGEQ